MISTILALVMVLAVVATVPMTVGAATTRNTGNDVFFKEASIENPATSKNVSNTGLDAYYGKPDMDGKYSEGEAWDNAIPLTLNSTTEQSLVNEGFTSSYDGDIYLLWDENFLYVLEVQRAFPWSKLTGTWETVASKDGANTAPFLWGNSIWHGTQLTVCENEDVTQNASLSDAAKSTWMHQITYFPVTKGKTSNELALDTTYEGILRVRYGGFSATDTDYQTLKAWHPYADLFKETGAYYGIASNMKTYFTKTSENGCIMETQIPWEFISRTEGAKAPTDAGIGLKIYMGNTGNSHVVSHTNCSNGDFSGFDPIKLISQSNTKIHPDYAYWLDAEDGQFITNNPKAGGMTYEISTAAQLIALSEIIENLAYNETVYGLSAVGLANNNEKAYLTRGNTFKLMNDIDLNPGVDWEKANAYFETVYGGGTYDITKLDFKMPVNIFAGLDDFYGIIDGQGYSIKGLYNPNGFLYSNGRYDKSTAVGGLIGRLAQGGIIDLAVESGFVGTCTMKGNVQMGGLIAEIRTEAYTDYTVADGATYANAEIIVSNVYVGANFTEYRYGIRTEELKSGSTTEYLDVTYAYGGVVGSIWPGTKDKAASIKCTFSDIIFSGTMLDDPNNNAKHGTRTSIVLGNNFPTDVASKTIANGTTKLVTTMSNIIGNVSAAPVTGEIVTSIHNDKTTDTVILITKGTGVPDGKEGAWVALTDGGVAPIKVADMLSGAKWQATTADANGKYNVRIVGEIDSLNYKNVGYKVTLKGTVGDVTKTLNLDFSDGDRVYKSIIADGATITADNLGMMNGDYLFATVLANLNTSVTYELYVQAVYTLSDGTVVTGLVQDLGTLSAWPGAAN